MSRLELLRLLHACKQEPDDDHARFVLADWLEEHGDANDRDRAAFVRFQMDAVPERGGTSFTLWPGRRWERGVRRWAFHSRYRASCYRGLVSTTLAPKLALGPRAGEVAASEEWAWVESVDLDSPRSPPTGLLASPLLDPVARVTLHRRVDARLLAEHFRPAWRTLHLHEVVLGEDGLSPLLRTGKAAHLRSLNLYRTWFSEGGMAALCDGLPALDDLTLPSLESTSEVWQSALARSPWKLRELALWGGSCEGLARVAAGADCCAGLRAFRVVNGTGRTAALRDVRFWPTLEELSLDGSRLNESRLADVRNAPRLRRLSLTGTEAGVDRLPALAASTPFAALDRLDLRFTQLGPEGAEALTAMPAAPLQLVLAGCSIGDEGLATLARWPGFARCRDLSLPNNGITDEGAAALAGSPHARGLVGLNLFSNRIGDRGRRVCSTPTGRADCVCCCWGPTRSRRRSSRPSGPRGSPRWRNWASAWNYPCASATRSRASPT